MTETRTPLVEVLEDLAADRGFADVEQLAEAVNASGITPRYKPNTKYTARELLRDPRPGFGKHLDGVLGMSYQEKQRLGRAWSETFLGR